MQSTSSLSEIQSICPKVNLPDGFHGHVKSFQNSQLFPQNKILLLSDGKIKKTFLIKLFNVNIPRSKKVMTVGRTAFQAKRPQFVSLSREGKERLFTGAHESHLPWDLSPHGRIESTWQVTFTRAHLFFMLDFP